MRKLVLAVLSGGLLLSAGCAGTDTSSSGAGGAGQRQVNQPTGAPIVVGLTNQEGSPSGSWPELREAAQAAVKYVNTELGGVHGRPVRLETCVTNGSPEGSAKCANTILGKKPLVVLGGAEVGTSASMAIYTKARMPYLGGAPISFPVMSAPNSVQWAGYAVGGLPALAAYAANQLHARKVVIVHPGLPGTEDFVGALMKPVLQASGVADIRMLASDVTQPDKTALVSAVAQARPDAVIVIEAGAGCLSVLQAHAAIAGTIPLLVTGNCLDPGLLATAGPAAEGVYTQAEYLYPTEPDHPDVKVFTRVLRDYAPQTRVTDFAATGFAGVMNLYHTLTTLPANRLDAATILKTLKAARNAPNFMSHPFTCDGRFAFAPAVCNGAQRILQVDGGRLVNVGGDWMEAAAGPRR